MKENSPGHANYCARCDSLGRELDALREEIAVAIRQQGYIREHIYKKGGLADEFRLLKAERDKMREALAAWEHWYSVDSTEFNREVARESGLVALARSDTGGEHGKGAIPIKAAERLSDQYNVPMVVVFAIHADQENFTITTYGKTKALCRLAAGYGEKLAESVLKVAELVQLEPKHLPQEPAVWEGTQ